MSLSSVTDFQKKIFFENESFVVIDKEGGILSVPSRIGKEDPRPCLGLLLQDYKRTQVFPVHRLDYEVSGLTLFALSALAHKEANSWFEHRKIKKTYQAFTEGQSPLDYEPLKTYKWTSKLLRGKKRAYESPAGKPAVTEFQFCGLEAESMSLKWELYPQTGRPHQLRYELFKRNFPILGDQLYGAKKPYGENSIALRATRLDLDAGIENTFGLPRILNLEPLFKKES